LVRSVVILHFQHNISMISWSSVLLVRQIFVILAAIPVPIVFVILAAIPVPIIFVILAVIPVPIIFVILAVIPVPIIFVSWIRHTTSVVIGTDCICSYKSNYHTVTITTSPHNVCKKKGG
jgi:hypothetical protein